MLLKSNRSEKFVQQIYQKYFNAQNVGHCKHDRKCKKSILNFLQGFYFLCQIRKKLWSEIPHK